jgi:hypothetical protein
VHWVNNLYRLEIGTHTAEQLVPEPSSFEVEINEKLKMCKSLGIDQILAQLNQTGGNTICSGIHKLINSIWHKEELPKQRKEFIIMLIYKDSDKTDCSNYWEI